MSEALVISTVRRRWILVGFIVLLGGAGVLNAVVKQHVLSNSEGQNAVISAVNVSARASSAAWYCPGPLALGHRGQHASIAIANLSTSVRTAQIHVSTNAGATMNQSITLAAKQEKTVQLIDPKEPTYGAVTVVIDGPGVGVNEIESASTGIATAPCTTHTSTHTYFGAGSTAGLSNMAISMYNPGATPAVANVTFTTGSSVTIPAVFSSVPIEPGQDLVVFAGHVLPQKNAFSAEVTTVSGQLAVGALDIKDIENSLDDSLVVGTAVAQPTWYLSPVVAAQGVRQSFVFVNPSNRSEHVGLQLLGTEVGSVSSVFVGANSAVHFTPPTGQRSGITGALVTVRGGGSVIAERELSISHLAALDHVVSGADLPQRLRDGYAVTQANAVTGRTWLVAGGRSDGLASEIVGVVNPGSGVVTVAFAQLLNGKERAIPGAHRLKIRAHGSASVNLHRLLTSRSDLAVVVTGTKPIIVGATQFGTGRQGLSAPAPLLVR